MSKLGDTFSKAGVSPLGDEEPDADGDSDGTGAGEVSASRLMMKAKTPEEHARALKSFLELCVPKIMEGGY